eukprot:5385150-Lingulodinium_polyedra.AAC.1
MRLAPLLPSGVAVVSLRVFAYVCSVGRRRPGGFRAVRGGSAAKFQSFPPQLCSEVVVVVLR